MASENYRYTANQSGKEYVGVPRTNMVKTATLVDQSGNRSTGYYDTAKQAYAEMLENARKQNAADAEAQIGKLGADAQQAGTGLWNTYQQQMRRTPQQLAAMGISGGAAESSMVGAGNNYLQQMAELDRQRRQQETDIRLNQSTNDNNAYLQYMNNMLALDQSNRDFGLREQEAQHNWAQNDRDYALREQEAQKGWEQSDRDFAMRQQLAELEKQQNDRDYALREQDTRKGWEQSDRDYGLKEQAAELEKQQLAMQDAMSYADLTGDYSLLIQYGYTPEQIAQLQKAWQVDNAKKYAAMTATQKSGTKPPKPPEGSGDIVNKVITASHQYSEAEIKAELDDMLADGTLSEADYRKSINALGTMQRRLTN